MHHAAKAYGKWPHEVLELDMWEIGFAMLCFQQAEATSAELTGRLNASGFPVFPVRII